MGRRIITLGILLVVSWFVMIYTHELGHIVGGYFSGGRLQSADLLPWHLPYSIFDPDPFPLITLWSGLLMGVLAPLAIAVIVHRPSMWFIANFCMLANGAYIGLGWFSKDRFLDTPQLLAHGSHAGWIAVYCMLTIGLGYIGFRRSCIELWLPPGDTKPTGS